MSDIYKRDTYVELGELEEGEYLIYVSVDWTDNTPEEDRFYNITSYGPESAEFEVLENDSEKGELDLLVEIFINKAKNDSNCYVTECNNQEGIMRYANSGDYIT